MANPTNKRIHKPGFLLIEVMCAFLFMIITGSIMGFYVALGHKQQQISQNRFCALLVAGETIDELRNGAINFKTGKKDQMNLAQVPVILAWSDGTQDQVWVATVQAHFIHEQL